jgi:hypothetical protein
MTRDLCGCLRAGAVLLGGIPWLPGSFFAEFGGQGNQSGGHKTRDGRQQYR